MKDSHKYKYVNLKKLRNFNRENQNLDHAIRHLGHTIYNQKKQSKLGISKNMILHIVNFKLLNPN